MSEKTKCIKIDDKYYLNLEKCVFFERYSIDEFIKYSKIKNYVNCPSINIIDKSNLLISENGDFKSNFTESNIPFGNYILKRDYNKDSMYLKQLSEIYSDKYINLYNKNMDTIESNLERFMLMKEKYKSLNLIYKRRLLNLKLKLKIKPTRYCV